MKWTWIDEMKAQHVRDRLASKRIGLILLAAVSLPLVLLWFGYIAVAGTEYGRVTFMDDVEVGNWNSISNMWGRTTSGGTYTSGSYDFLYRTSGTNRKGRLVLSTNVNVVFTGSATENAVALSWPRYDGLMSIVVLRSDDAGSTWEWRTVGPSVTQYVDVGSTGWDSSDFESDYSEIASPTVPWLDSEQIAEEFIERNAGSGTNTTFYDSGENKALAIQTRNLLDSSEGIVADWETKALGTNAHPTLDWGQRILSGGDGPVLGTDGPWVWIGDLLPILNEQSNIGRPNYRPAFVHSKSNVCEDLSVTGQMRTPLTLSGDHDADGAKDLLAANGYNMSVLTTNMTVNFNNSMSLATMQGLIDEVPRRMADGAKITFQFADGTYTLSDNLVFEGFRSIGGGGNAAVASITIQGNTSPGSVKYTTQTVYLDFGGGYRKGVLIRYNAVPISFIHIKARCNSDFSYYGALACYDNSCSISAYYDYFIDVGTSSGTALAAHGTGLVNCYRTYFAGGQSATFANRRSMVFHQDTATTSPLPQYGVGSFDGGVTVRHVSGGGTLPTGSVGATFAAEGGVVR